jgi:hypothetical protein
MPDRTAAADAGTNWEAELERSRQASGRLLEMLARKLGVSREAGPMTARGLASGLERAARRRPLYALAAAVGAGLLLGWLLTGGARARE